MRFKNVTPISQAEFERDIYKPGLLSRIERMPSPLREQYLALMSHFTRAEEGMRVRPDLLPDGGGYKPAEPNIANKHGLAMPFSPKDTHRPDHEASPEFMKHGRAVHGQFVKEQLTNELQEKMGTDADRPLPPPTLRDQIAAAAAIHSQE